MTQQLLRRLINSWHSWMDMPIESLDWYYEKLSSEITELATAPNWLMRLSEESDVLYSHSRARHDGYDLRIKNIRSFYRCHIAVYMFAKFSSRRLFYISVGKKLSPPKDMKALRNPKKVENLIGLAKKHGYNETVFCYVAQKKLKNWPFLP